MEVSIIVPIFNVEKYITRCLDSISNQTFKDFEVILIDDCGNDNSIQIARDYILKKKLHNYTIIPHLKNLGLSAARNTGIRHSKGKYIYFLDSDDTISPNCIEILYNSINDTNADFSMGKIASVSTNKITILHENNISNCMPYSSEDLINLYLKSKLPWNAVNRLIKLDFIKRNNLYFRDNITSEDLLWNYQLLPLINSVILINDVTYFYYQTPNSIMTSANKSKKFALDLVKIGGILNAYQKKYNSKLLSKYYIYIKHTFIPYSILWHQYNKFIRDKLLYSNLDDRFRYYLYLPLTKKIYYLMPRKIIPYIERLNFILHEYNLIVQHKLKNIYSLNKK